MRALWLAAIVCAAFIGDGLRKSASEHAFASERYEDIYYLPAPHALRAISLGYYEAMADLIWIRALLYLGDEFGHGRAMRYIFNYTDSILALDPDFKRAYRWVGTAGIYRTAEVTEKDFLKTIEYLRQGVERFPEDPQMAWSLGATLAYETNTFIKEPARRDAFKRQATPYLLRAAEGGVGPPWLALSVTAHAAKLGQLEQSVSQLERLYAMIDDPEAKAELGRRIANLRQAADVEGARGEISRMEMIRDRAFPYLELPQVAALGPRIFGDAHNF